MRGCVITCYRQYKGKKLGPYYFRKWKVGRKVFKKYIKPADVEKVQAACQNTKQRRKEINRFLDNADWLRRMCERYDRGKEATPEQETYIQRLHREGMHITGRPPFRPRRLSLLQRLVNTHGIDAICDWLYRNPDSQIQNPNSKIQIPKSENFGAPIFSKVDESEHHQLAALLHHRSFIKCFQRTKDLAVARWMTVFEDIQIEIGRILVDDCRSGCAREPSN